MAALSLGIIVGLIAYGLRASPCRPRAGSPLAQNLGQEIAKMEWLLRSARQLPLHDLNREKSLVRSRMRELQQDLLPLAPFIRGSLTTPSGADTSPFTNTPMLSASFASLSISASMPLTFTTLSVSPSANTSSSPCTKPDSPAAETGLKSSSKTSNPSSLSPPSLLYKSRALKSDSPDFLETLIAFYLRDFDRALKAAASAQTQAPWLYEGWKLMADIHVERALKARDSGKYDLAETEFASAVSRYLQTAEIGRSDNEVYEGLAEAWVRQIEMDAERGKHRRSVQTSDRRWQQSHASRTRARAGALKERPPRCCAASCWAPLRSELGRTGQGCIAEMQGVIEKEPDNPYAATWRRRCYAIAADAAQGRGENPEPIIRKSRSSSLSPFYRSIRASCGGSMMSQGFICSWACTSSCTDS